MVANKNGLFLIVCVYIYIYIIECIGNSVYLSITTRYVWTTDLNLAIIIPIDSSLG